MKNKLQRMKKHMSHTQEAASNEVEDSQTNEMNPSNELSSDWEMLQGRPLYLDDQYVIKREVVYELSDVFGAYSFHELFQAHKLWNETLTFEHPLHPQDSDVEDLIFFDTETTGLKHGAGTTIFLLGYAQVTEQHVKVHQFILPGPEHEAAMYYHFLKELPEQRRLVTFNGRAFDWPQVKTRHTFVRNEVPKLPQFGHIDLLHASRRLYRPFLSSFKLKNVEEEMLRIYRTEDTPGYLAPMLYFDYVQLGDPNMISGVLQHNEWDVLSLIQLYIDLSYRVCCQGSYPLEQLEIGRWFEYIGALEEAKASYLRGKDENESELLYRLGTVYKKTSQLREAEEAFYFASASEGAFGCKACIELAKIYEHQHDQIQKALYYTQLAEAKAEPLSKVPGVHYTKDIKNRLTRLCNKSPGHI
ncbi:hypothetical protein B0H94_101268 [Salsuginibacillus halophilus]|uniref:YprB ribonuclease H-like domain-containing protein n=1 Tax=Salsuginibacillus halophilus TaxID=517424 RepID=A0A2P8HYW7_9BACI|nr:ribonuclease H-like domain-containing protein [Salsuginibacillus halophilus]PSL51354.1 hypothetical protein B0H94_101268 [Salsuginibacillus halophilus]